MVADGEFVIRKTLWRILPFLFLLYVIAYLDRINVGFAALEMRQQLGFSDATYGLGAGLFFAGYLIFQLPSNLVLQRIGARRWISLLMILWGVISASMMFMNSARSFYALRFLLGAAEAGFFPGILFYFRSWFPEQARARAASIFLTAGPVSGIIGGPLSGALLGLNNLRGLAGWQWLFLIEGLPAVLLGTTAYFLILDRPEDATWLDPAESSWLATQLREEDRMTASPSTSLPQGTASLTTLSAREGVSGRYGAFADSRVWALAFVYFGLNTCAYGITLWLPVSLRSVSGVSDLVLGLVSTIPYLAAAIVMVLFGLHSDRTDERRWHTAVAGACSACAFVFAGYSHHAVGLVAAFTLAMVGVQAMAGPFWAMSTGLFSRSSAAVGIALINSLGNLGSGFGPYWIGHTRTATGGFRSGLWTIAAILAVAVVVTIAVPLPRRKGDFSGSWAQV